MRARGCCRQMLLSPRRGDSNWSIASHPIPTHANLRQLVPVLLAANHTPSSGQKKFMFSLYRERERDTFRRFTFNLFQQFGSRLPPHAVRKRSRLGEKTLATFSFRPKSHALARSVRWDPPDTARSRSVKATSQPSLGSIKATRSPRPAASRAALRPAGPQPGEKRSGTTSVRQLSGGMR